ncbi:MAG: glucose-6-phosphate dehydrogenase [Acetobacter fabarum]|jgi:glucose-6-phosphate 1-dehydrogenase|nr:glucose-6-phosphate dehydrogenase [Acetobacter fabarum]MCI1908958.1 glucose-6-phosphate dehydrogenase [Acetobacter fabarum]MCI1927802.1 glucose-6-phosphate dehydrogenase [Acetobacter fabarum]MCI1947819.1 glucose-6-phosphate dehydrogenase [Acetobacter fabarum]MCI1988555.1 glucose-6-phosphate dehydrogenase [Acetobacter fabarum]
MALVNHTGPFDFVIFGATGDLSRRKLLPAFLRRFHAQEFSDDAQIICIARTELNTEQFREQTEAALREFAPETAQDEQTLRHFLGLLTYITLDALKPGGDWQTLDTLLSANDRPRVFYLATAPALYSPLCEALARHNLINQHSRVVLEKPIGVNLETARAINQGVGQFFPEASIYRIDHYLGKEGVQNILALRFANPALEKLWSSEAIAHVQITAAETVGVGSRGSYYDESGALRDMVQNHLLQVLCMVAMDAPASLGSDDLRNEKLKVLNALRPMTPDMVRRNVIRGQYVAGEIKRQDVPGYNEDLGTGRASNTETFVAIRTKIRTARWGHTPFYLRTGKRLATKTTEIVIQFRPQVWPIFTNMPSPGRLVIRIAPREELSFVMAVRDPGAGGFRVRNATLGMSYENAFSVTYQDSYERLLLDAVRGDPALFIRRDEVEASWQWIEPILNSWRHAMTPLEPYPAGSWGPASTRSLLARDGALWHEDMLT